MAKAKTPANTSSGGKIGRPKRTVTPKSQYDTTERMSFLVSPYVKNGLQRFAEEIEKREARSCSVHELARRIVNATMVDWLRQVESGELDISDPNWRAPC